MTPQQVTVRVPATTANLGPGFDCIGMALDLWNETTIEIGGSDISVAIDGFGKGSLPQDHTNLIISTMRNVYKEVGKPFPSGLQIHCHNGIPFGSGLGSSSAAVLTGLFAANFFLGAPYNEEQILEMAVEIEGHPDNVCAAVYGGMVICVMEGSHLITRRMQPAAWHASVVIPEFDLPTQAARAALPALIPLADAIFNLGRFALLIDALQNGDAAILEFAMQDRIHQPYRIQLIPGAAEALSIAKQAGMSAAAVSGAGPGLIAFSLKRNDRATQMMKAVIEKHGLKAHAFNLTTSSQGLQLSVNEEHLA